jgi:hypothetical protein
MEFQMGDIPMSDPRVGESVARCLLACDRAIGEAIAECEGFMPEQDWRSLRLGFGHILGGDMLSMWITLVKCHPKYNAQAFGT